jgi:hypothetical protein
VLFFLNLHFIFPVFPRLTILKKKKYNFDLSPEMSRRKASGKKTQETAADDARHRAMMAPWIKNW